VWRYGGNALPLLLGGWLGAVAGDRSVKDFAYAVESITPNWSEYWKNELQRLEWKKEKLPSFFELVEIYRNHYRTELAQKGKTLQGSFAVTEFKA